MPAPIVARRARASPAKLREWREQHSLSQEDAARWWGCSLRTWQRYETGTTTIPGPLAKRLNQSPQVVKVVRVPEFP